jgi:membrane-bound lytic murein transglycosylase D
MNCRLRPLPFVASLLLAACATAPVPRADPPRVTPPPNATLDIGTNAAAPSATRANTQVWDRLRASFAMADCAADPQVAAWARRYTQSPVLFETQMRAVLPRLVYVQESAARHGVPGEFVLLPWVESHFRPIPPQRSRPAGAWQMVPSTARHLGLTIERDYDARLDLEASTEAAMRLLRRYHDRFGDWRLVTYAYNAGRYGIDRLVAREGMPPAEPVVPTLPVRAGTREHLVKLLAIACVVREPARFHVTLPTLEEDRQLVGVQLSERLSLADAARQAGMPLATLATLNAGYRNGVIDTRHGGRVLLPRRYAEPLRTALLARASDAPGDRTASLGTTQLPDERSSPDLRESEQLPDSSDAATPIRLHVVEAGDTLYGIARKYGVRVTQLKRWNRLRASALQVGQKIALSGAN